MLLLVELIHEDVDDPVLAVLGRQLRRGHLLHELLVRDAVLDEVGDGDDEEVVLLSELHEVWHARHRAVLVHDFADDACRIEPGDARQVDSRLGLAGPLDHAAAARAQGEHVTGTQQVVGLGGRVDRHLHRRRAVLRRDAGGGPPLGLDRDAERRLEAGGILRHHERNLEFVEPLRRHRQADEAAPVLRHEVDRLGRDLVGSNRQVALVLPVFIVDDDDHLSLAEGVEGIFDPGDGAVLLAGPFGDLHMGLHGPAAWPTHRPAMTRYVSPVRRSAQRTFPPCRTRG